MSESELPTGEPARHALPRRLLHDLRTPLNHIIGFSALLAEQAQEEGCGDSLGDVEKIHAAGQRLLLLINDNFDAAPEEETQPVHEKQRDHGQAAESIAAESSVSEPTADAKQGFVLVVDDVETNRDVLSRQLKRQGYAVAVAENGPAALEQLRMGKVDLVLLDIMMPEMDGYEVLQRLKADPALRHIPVIMISALNEFDSVVRCIELGAEDYLPKPFNPTLLKARLGASLEKKRARDREQDLASALHAQNREMAAWRKAQEADLALARTTQRRIVNSVQPPLAGWKVETIYRPLIQVGGDIHGWQAIDHGSCLFWIVDATGHGVAAALFTTLAALLFNHASTLSGTAHGILTRVNAEFYTLFSGRSFMTACCAVVQSNGRLSFAGAGHPPLLIRRQNGSVEALPSLTTMIGLYPAAEIDATVTTLAPGDTALLYTDGLYSSKNENGERLTPDALAEAVARLGGSAGFLPRVIEELNQTSPDRGFDDDVAAIAVRRE